MIGLEIEYGDLTEQLAKMKGFDRIAEKHMRSGANQAMKLMVREWQKAAPSESGRYKGSISGKVKSVVGMNVTGIVGESAINQGYPYPRLLEYSPKHHYRSTSRAGSGTAGQAKKAIDSTEKDIYKELNKMLDRVATELVVK